MEKMPYQPDMDRPMTTNTTTPVTSDWRNALPVMTGTKVTMRELEVSDAASLFAMLTPEEVSRFISPPPTTVEGFEKFILWARSEREAGRYACFAVVPHGMSTAVGLFQVRQLEAGFATAEWGFALGSSFWGTGMFIDAGQLVVEIGLAPVKPAEFVIFRIGQMASGAPSECERSSWSLASMAYSTPRAPNGGASASWPCLR